MTFYCNGCGGEFDTLAATFSYGNVGGPRPPDRAQHFPEGELPDAVEANHHKTLCPRCMHVLKDILMSSDLSDHWHKYDWTMQRDDSFTDEYDT